MSINILELHSLLTQFSSAILATYKGSAKENLSKYKEFMAKIKDRTEIELRDLLSYQVTQIKSFYNTYLELITTDKIIVALNDADFNLYIKLQSPVFIPISDATIEACIENSVKDLNNIEGYMYSLLNICLDDNKAIQKVLSKYTKTLPDIDKLNIDIDKVAAGIMSKVSINDPNIQSKVQNLSSVFMESLKDVVGVSVVELEKQGIDLNTNSNNNLSVARFIPVLSNLIQNPKIANTIENSIKKMGGQEKLTGMIDEVLTPKN